MLLHSIQEVVNTSLSQLVLEHAEVLKYSNVCLLLHEIKLNRQNMIFSAP